MDNQPHEKKKTAPNVFLFFVLVLARGFSLWLDLRVEALEIYKSWFGDDYCTCTHGGTPSRVFFVSRDTHLNFDSHDWLLAAFQI